MSTSAPLQLLTEAEAAKMLSLSPATLRNWRCVQPDKLRWVRLSTSRIAYRLSDIERFIQRSTVGGDHE